MKLLFTRTFVKNYRKLPKRIQSATDKKLEYLLSDPEHPSFSGFPTEFHGNWQWWHLMKNCQPMVMDATAATYRPILQMVDGFDRNHKLGLVCEAKVGKGSLLICSIDLPGLQDHPEARQLLSSLLRYAGSRDFRPHHELDTAILRGIL